MIDKKFLESIKEYGMFEPGDLVLVAVSGGVDSTALLHLLARHKDELGISLHIVHLNHMLRKGDADLDVKFVEGLAQKLNLQVEVEAVDVAEIAKREKMGIEEAARYARYDFFERIASRTGAKKIAVAHTADDNVETFLMRLLRGAGLKGLTGIPPKRGRIVRPLIKTWRREIEDYVGALKLVPRRDHTNYESRYMRNSVRLKLVPQLKIYNLNIKEIILQTILLVTEDNLYLENRAAEMLEETTISFNPSEIKLSLAKLNKLERTMQRYVFRLAVEKVKGDLAQLAFGHIADILEKLGATEKWELHLPGGIFALGNKDSLTFCREKEPAKTSPDFKYNFSVPGRVELTEIGKVISGAFVGEVEKRENRNCAFVDYSALGKDIFVRNKLPGDRFSPLGVKGTKKLQDFFVDEKVPADERNSVPILESGGKIIWVAGQRLDDRAKVTDKTKKIVKFELL